MSFIGLCVLSASTILFISMLDAASIPCEKDQGCVCIDYPGAGKMHCISTKNKQEPQNLMTLSRTMGNGI